jgi:hypothetical protein
MEAETVVVLVAPKAVVDFISDSESFIFSERMNIY